MGCKIDVQGTEERIENGDLWWSKLEKRGKMGEWEARFMPVFGRSGMST
jgi:hypothetical protein